MDSAVCCNPMYTYCKQDFDMCVFNENAIMWDRSQFCHRPKVRVYPVYSYCVWSSPATSAPHRGLGQ